MKEKIKPQDPTARRVPKKQNLTLLFSWGKISDNVCEVPGKEAEAPSPGPGAGPQRCC